MKCVFGVDSKRFVIFKRTYFEFDEAFWNVNFILDGIVEDKFLWVFRVVFVILEEFVKVNGVDGFKFGGGAFEKRVADVI